MFRFQSFQIWTLLFQEHRCLQTSACCLQVKAAGLVPCTNPWCLSVCHTLVPRHMHSPCRATPSSPRARSTRCQAWAATCTLFAHTYCNSTLPNFRVCLKPLPSSRLCRWQQELQCPMHSTLGWLLLIQTSPASFSHTWARQAMSKGCSNQPWGRLVQLSTMASYLVKCPTLNQCPMATQQSQSHMPCQPVLLQ